MKKKTVALSLALTLVFAGAAGGTMAWLMDETKPVVNTFTESDIDIKLEEKTGETYQMVPGHTIAKDPKASVLTGSEPCYLFVKLEKTGQFDKYLSYEIADGWTLLEGNVYYRTVMDGDMGTEYSVLKGDQVTVKSTVTKEDMNGLTEENYPKLTVTAYASQYWKDAETSFTAGEAWANISGSTTQ